MPKTKRPTTRMAKVGARAVTSAPIRYKPAANINSLLRPTVHFRDSVLNVKNNSNHAKKNNSPRKSAILKAKIDPIKAPYNEPLVCKYTPFLQKEKKQLSFWK